MKIIKTRDVIFNESLFYNSNEPDLAAILRLPADQIIEVVEVLCDHNLPLLTENLELDSDLDDDDIDYQDEAGEQLQISLNTDLEPKSASFHTLGKSAVIMSNTESPMLLMPDPTPTPSGMPEPEPEPEPTQESETESEPEPERRIPT